MNVDEYIVRRLDQGSKPVHPCGTNGSDPWAQAEEQQKGRRLTDSPMGAGEPCDGPVGYSTKAKYNTAFGHHSTFLYDSLRLKEATN